MTLTSTVAALAMAFGAPLVYADQAWSIQKKRSSEGFSKDVCAVLLIANVARIFFWLGERFEFALLLQSILMIAAQLFLLSLLIKFRPGSFASSTYSVGSGDRADTGTGPSQPSAAAPQRMSTSARQTDVAEFAADEAFDGPNGTTAAKDTPTSGPGLFTSTSSGAGGGGYAPLLFGLQLPPAPTLGLDDGEEEEEDVDAPSSARGRIQRFGKKTVRFVQAGWKRGGSGTRKDGSSASRPFGFWTWPDYSSYVLFLVAFAVVLGILHIFLGSLQTYVWLLGMFALGLEATLPVPQAVTNQRRKSLSGFRTTVLLGWLGGDVYKTIYFLVNGSPIQFIISALFALSVDCVICAQLYFFRDRTATDDDEARARQAEAMEAGRRQRGPIEDGGPSSNSTRATTTKSPSRSASAQGPKHASVDESSHFQIEADDDDDDDDHDDHDDDGDMGRSRH